MTAPTAFAISRERLMLLLMGLILALGMMSYLTLPKREDPEITIRTTLVMATHPGLDLAQLEELVARPLEEATRAIEGVDEIRTRIGMGTVVLEVDLETSVPEAAIPSVFGEIEDDLAALAPTMPEGTRGPLINTDFGAVSIASIALTGPDFSLSEIKDQAEVLRDRLYGKEGISAVEVHGVQDERIWLETRSEAHGNIYTLLPVIAKALQGQNVSLSAGSILLDGQRMPVEISGELRNADQIADLLVEVPGAGKGARLVRLGDLITVRRGTVDPAERPVFHNGRPAILLSVEMAAGEDITVVGDMLRGELDAFAASLPVGMAAELSTFQPAVVADSVNEALVNMGQTFVVVLFVMLAFIGWRQALIVATIVPLAVGFAFALMPVAGVVLQQVSIAAIIISLGLLVDNGVVIIEDMDSRIREGSSRTDAARAAGSQYTLPLAIASVTTAAAFLPLFLLDGTEGQYGYSLGAVVALMLTGSFIAATSFLPVLAIRFLPEPKATPAPGILERLGTGYGRLVRLGLRAPWVMVLLCLLVVAGGVSQMGKVPQQMFPLSERAQLLVYFDLPRGSDISATESEALRFSEWLRSNEEVTSVTSFIGYGGPRFVLSLDPAETDPASAFMVVNTSDFGASEKLLPRARAELDRAFPDARVRLKRVAMGGREPGLEVAISGPDPDRLLAAAHDVEAGFSSAPGLTENAGDWGNRRLIGRVIVAQDEARLHGLSTRDLSQTMAGMLEGRPISVLREGDSQIPITLRLDPESMEGPMAVANMTISTSAGLILTEQIASFEPDLEFSSLRRVNGQRRVTVTAISTELTAPALADHIAPTLERLQEELGPEYDIALGGEIEQSAEVREKLGGGFPAAVAVMLVALMVQFNSFRRVVVTLACVPLVIAGVPLALLAFGQPLSFFGTLGMIALSGIVINNAIVLIDQIDIERRTMSLDAAIAESARKRFRPILLTSLTTVLGLIPMATTGGGLWEPMATLMIGGLGLASVLTLFYVPALYRLALSREINGGPQV